MTQSRRRADLVVIGAGSGGLSVAAGAARLGLSVVLFERGAMGGDCLNTGCVPSKALLAAAARAQAVRTAGRLGVGAAEPEIDFTAVMAHVHGAIAAIAPADSVERFEGLGVQVVREPARFASPRVVESASMRVEARRIVVATGSRPKIPPVDGLDQVAYLTNETVFGLQALPRRLLVLGAGAVGLELAQGFRRLGSEVAVLEAARVLAVEEPEAREVVLARLAAEGVELHEAARVLRAEPAAGGVALTVEMGGEIGGEPQRILGSHLLVAAGRSPDVEGLDLNAAGVAFDGRGIRTDRSLRTTNRRVFAIGDVTGRAAFTHAAGAQAALFVRKALFAAPVDAGALVIPRVLYTDPEVASVGLTEAQARERDGAAVRTVVSRFDDNDRARADGQAEGFAKLTTDARGRILGVSIVGSGAGELIGLWALALSARLKLSKIAGFVAPYPTRGEISKRLAGEWYAPVLFSPRTRGLVSLLKRLG